jgi:hypothetical protein
VYLQLQYAYVDNLKVHDVNDGAAVYALRSVKRTVTERRVTGARASRDGIVDRSLYKDQQTLDLAGYSWGPDNASAQTNHDALRGVFVQPGDHVFRFLRLGRTEEEQLTFRTAVAPDADSEGYSRTARWAATIIGADPRIYSAILKGGVYDPTTSLSGGGIAMPAPMPLVFSTTTVTELVVTNGGNYPTQPVFTITGPVSAPIIDNDTTGESIFLNYTLGTADTVVVDVGARQVYLNGASRRDLFIASTSTWFGLRPGQTALRLRGTGMTAGLTSLRVQYRDARV